MSGLILQNDRDDPPALLGEWLDARRIRSDTVEVWNDGVPDDPSSFDWVASLGSHCSVTDEEPAWIAAEVDFMRRAVAWDVPILGICFGGQALAVALGGEVLPVDPLSIGWLEAQTREPDRVPPGPWAHFNFERFTVPSDATLVAVSSGGPGAFRIGRHLGLQFHPEATTGMVNNWAADDAERLSCHGFSPNEIREQGRIHGDSAATQAFVLFDAWWATACRPSEPRERSGSHARTS